MGKLAQNLPSVSSRVASPEVTIVLSPWVESQATFFLQVRLVYAKVGQSRRCQNVPETSMLVDGARGNTMQQKKWAKDAN